MLGSVLSLSSQQFQEVDAILNCITWTGKPRPREAEEAARDKQEGEMGLELS